MAKYEELEVNELKAETFELHRPTWDDFVVSVGMAGGVSNSDPVWTQLGASGIFLPGFVHNQVNEVFFTMQTPHKAVVGERFKNYHDPNGWTSNELRLHIHWAPSTADAGVVRWGVDYVVFRQNAVHDDPVTIYADAEACGVAEQEQKTSLVHIDASDFHLSTTMAFRLFRDTTHANDTYPGVAMAISTDAHIPMGRLGSQQEYRD